MSVLQDLRLKLQKRVQWLRDTQPSTFREELIRFFDFLDSNPILAATAVELSKSFPQLPQQIDTALSQRQVPQGLTHAEQAALGYEALKRVSKSEMREMAFMNYVQMQRGIDNNFRRFNEQYLEPFYEYLDEHIDDSNTVLAELVHFKRIAEWFRRDLLWQLYIGAGRSGERKLAFAVYEFLYERGIEFQIEPASASGEADMVSAQKSDHPLVADVKLFDPDSSRGTAYIKRGFHQVYRYLQDFNQALGYLVVFRVTAKQISLAGGSNGKSAGVPSVTFGGKTIFLLDIDIYPHEEPASRRAPTQFEEISESDLKSELEAEPGMVRP